MAIVAGEEPAEVRLGTTLVVCPGRFDRGRYAVVECHDFSVEAATLTEPTAV